MSFGESAGNKLLGLDVPRSMLAKPIITLGRIGIDWKGLGYLTSIVSVFFLGAIAWPKPDDPAWHLPALILGMTTSVIGMGFRYKAHLDQQREIRKAKAEAEARPH